MADLDYLEPVSELPSGRKKSGEWPSIILNELLQSKFPVSRFRAEYVSKRFNLSYKKPDAVLTSLKYRLESRQSNGEDLPLGITGRDKGRIIYVQRFDLLSKTLTFKEEDSKEN